MKFTSKYPNKVVTNGETIIKFNNGQFETEDKKLIDILHGATDIYGIIEITEDYETGLEEDIEISHEDMVELAKSPTVLAQIVEKNKDTKKKKNK